MMRSIRYCRAGESRRTDWHSGWGVLMTRQYKVAVIGRTGRGNYGHGIDTVWKEIEGADVVAVADEDPKGRAAAAKRTGAERTS